MGAGAMSNDFVQLALKLSTDADFAAKLKELLDTKAEVDAAFAQLAQGQAAQALLDDANAKAAEIGAKWSTLNDEMESFRRVKSAQAQRQLDDAVKRAADLIDQARIKAEGMIAAAEAMRQEAEAAHAQMIADATIYDKAQVSLKQKEDALAQRSEAVMAMSEETRVEKARLINLAQSLIALAKQI
jgi:hypothetical protein